VEWNCLRWDGLTKLAGDKPAPLHPRQGSFGLGLTDLARQIVRCMTHA